VSRATDKPAGAAGPSRLVQPERDVRVKRAQRGQFTWGRVDLDAEVPADHEVRATAAVVDKLLRMPTGRLIDVAFTAGPWFRAAQRTVPKL
jgi:hypothetical protein